MGEECELDVKVLQHDHFQRPGAWSQWGSSLNVARVPTSRSFETEVEQYTFIAVTV